MEFISVVKILIVEDNEANLYLLEFLLKSKGVDIIIARNGLEGVSKAAREKPDVIFMDIHLPKMDGYEATRTIRKDIKMKETPIIAVTSFAMTGDRQKCIDAGCNDYIEKPIDPENFLKVIEKYLRKK